MSRGFVGIMTTPAIPLKEFDVEMASTRKLLERVPGDKGAWKPHEKSFSLGHLAQLVSWMPGWIAASLREPAIDLAKRADTARIHRHAGGDVRRERAARRARRSRR